MNQKTHFKKIRGAAIADQLVWIILTVAVLGFIISLVPQAKYMLNVSAFQSDVSTISSATYNWKKRRPNYAKVSIQKLCSDNYLSNSICGDSNDGKSTNPFGGDWTVTPNANPGLYNITATLPNDTNHINELADTMAPATRSNCSESDSCDTLTKTTNSITMTF